MNYEKSNKTVKWTGFLMLLALGLRAPSPVARGESIRPHPFHIRPPWHCSTFSALGEYGFAAQGVVEGNRVVAVGQMKLNGRGDAAFNGYYRIGGISFAWSDFGHYTVTPDCSGELMLDADGAYIQVPLQVVWAGSELRMIVNQPGITVTGVAERIHQIYY